MNLPTKSKTDLHWLCNPMHFNALNALYVVPLSLAANVCVGVLLNDQHTWLSHVCGFGGTLLLVLSSILFLKLASDQQVLWEGAQRDAEKDHPNDPTAALNSMKARWDAGGARCKLRLVFWSGIVASALAIVVVAMVPYCAKSRTVPDNVSHEAAKAVTGDTGLVKEAK